MSEGVRAADQLHQNEVVGARERRPRRDGEPRLSWMKFRVNQSERSEIRRAAQCENRAYGAWIAEVCLAAARKEVQQAFDPILAEVLEQLKSATVEANRIGINFNQAVRRMNDAGIATPEDRQRLAYCFEAVRRLDQLGVEIGRRLR